MPTFDLSRGPRGTREVFEYLKTCASRMYTDNYVNICVQIRTQSGTNISPRRVGKQLGHIRSQCIKHRVPWINALAVGLNRRKSNEWRPSDGFLPKSVSWHPSFEHLWRGMVLQVFSYDCRLIVNDVGFSWLRPESATLGLLVNGAVVTDTVRFGAGDRLELGDRTITLAGNPAASEMTWKLAFDVRERGEATPGSRVFHSERVTVGRTSAADLALLDGNVSRRHCMFYMDGSGQLRLKDLGSSNGMWVNGTRAADIAFNVGDELFAGNWIIRLAEAPKRVPA